MRILGIDPANELSACCLLEIHNPNNINIIEKTKAPNLEIRDLILSSTYDMIALEGIQSFGMPVGKTTFETCYWVGRFIELCYQKNIPYKIIYRKEVKLNLCNSHKAKDGNIRQTLIDRFARHDFSNGKGKKNNQDVFYGVSADIWSATALAVTYYDLYNKNE